jgi:hypothetical protein
MISIIMILNADHYRDDHQEDQREKVFLSSKEGGSPLKEFLGSSSRAKIITTGISCLMTGMVR